MVERENSLLTLHTPLGLPIWQNVINVQKGMIFLQGDGKERGR
jgi:hypothetical protein